MISKFAATALLALAVCAGQWAAAQDSTLGGAIFGGAAGAIIGGAVGGGRGAAIGAIVGRRHRRGNRRPKASRGRVATAITRTAAMCSRATARGSACRRAIARPWNTLPGSGITTKRRPARATASNARTGTFIGRDGYERPCP